MKRKHVIATLVTVILAVIILVACAPANNNSVNIQKVTPITSIKTKTSNGSNYISYYVYKVKIEETEYYLIRKANASNFKLIPVSKLNSTTETKDPYWNW